MGKFLILIVVLIMEDLQGRSIADYNLPDNEWHEMGWRCFAMTFCIALLCGQYREGGEEESPGEH